MTVKYLYIGLCSLLFISLAKITHAKAQINSPYTVAGIPVNYNEADVESYILPDPLILNNGEKVKNAEMWYNQRRPQILALFEQFQYGHTPKNYADVSFNTFKMGLQHLMGKPFGNRLLYPFQMMRMGQR